MICRYWPNVRIRRSSMFARVLGLLDPPDRQDILRILGKLNDRLNPTAENAAK